MYDSHSHIGLDPQQLPQLASVECPRLAVCSTCEEDWTAAQHAVELLNARPHSQRSCCAFGVHPWQAHTAKDGWDHRLRAALEASPGSFVGESGLDKAARTPDTGVCEWDAQLAVFETSLKLAAELHRPVTLHCVRASGPMMQMLSAAEALPPAIGMHSYSGSPETLKALVALGNKRGCAVYFGFSEAVNTGPALNKLKKNIEACPKDRLLLETDLSDPQGEDEAMDSICKVVAGILGEEPQEIAQLCSQNAAQLYDTL